MAGTGRAVVVTIHQPRSEIFHAFDKILLLCKGQVAFFGSPVKVWEFFRKALIMEKELEVCLHGSCDVLLVTLADDVHTAQIRGAPHTTTHTSLSIRHLPLYSFTLVVDVKDCH